METLSALGIAIGLGSFTSLRVGLALAKGIAYSRGIPLVGVRTLDILAQAQPVGELPLAVAIQAGRRRYALGWYQGVRGEWQARDDARVVTVEALIDEVTSPSVVCGEFTDEIRQNVGENKNVHLTSPDDSMRKPSVLAAWRGGRGS